MSGVAVAPVGDLTVGEGRAYVVGGRQVAVFLLSDGTVRAVDAVCPHRGGPLADGQADLAVLVCPLHQHAFSLATGVCATSGGVGAVRVYPASVRDGVVLVEV